MFGFNGETGANAKAVLAALGRSLAIIEFDPQGKILFANDNFCKAVGYDLSEIVGQHHSIFVQPDYAHSAEYKNFWERLRRGEYDSKEYKRLGKGGREVWIQASYNPVKNAKGAVVKIVKQATDITAQKLVTLEINAKLNAISRVQAVIEFTPNGEIITANENFLKTLGYRLDEIQGKSHKIFVEPGYAQSQDYKNFWARLNAGEFFAAEFRRIGKGGKEVWIQASYNPVFDLDNKVVKVVKFATDITNRVLAINEIASGLTQLAENNLVYRIEEGVEASFEKLRINFNQSLEKLQVTLFKINESISAIRSGAQEISSATDELSERTERQAASLEETAAALDEITATIKKSSEGMLHARQVVEAAESDAERSSEVVTRAVQAMDAIQQSSQQISQIIGVIDEIAFQTNLLALNAGVEAARAGDSGRGFAVVASEVRALAQRSAEAAKDIKKLISTSAIHVDQGVELVKDTGNTLTRIVSQVSEINAIVGEMTAGSQEQSVALNEVNSAINQMDQVTQHNAAMAEQSNAASANLAQETENLRLLINQFQVGQSREEIIEFKRAKPKRASAQPMRTMKVSNMGTAAVRKPLPDQTRDSWEEF